MVMPASSSRLTAIASLLLLGMLPMANHAQAIYRCGNSYSQMPCPDASVIQADDRRSAEQKAQTDAAAAQAARQADRMEHERLARERMAVAAQTPTRPEPTSAKRKVSRSKRLAATTKPPAQPYFTASSERNDKKKREARSGK